MPIVVPDSLPQCGDNDSTLVQSFPEDWIHTPFIMDLLAKEGSPAPESSSVAMASGAPAQDAPMHASSERKAGWGDPKCGSSVCTRSCICMS